MILLIRRCPGIEASDRGLVLVSGDRTVTAQCASASTTAGEVNTILKTKPTHNYLMHTMAYFLCTQFGISWVHIPWSIHQHVPYINHTMNTHYHQSQMVKVETRYIQIYSFPVLLTVLNVLMLRYSNFPNYPNSI